ncbi:MAG: hypothetical protein AAGD40_01500 [Pseudomonadota bacterium]
MYRSFHVTTLSCALILGTLSACARGDSEPWPSLAYRPGETAALGPCGRDRLNALPSMPAPATDTPGAEIAALADPADTDEAELARTLDRIIADWDRQQEVTATAVANAAATADGSIARGTAEIELSRLDGIYGRAAALHAAMADPSYKAVRTEDSLRTRLAEFRDRHLVRFTALRRQLHGYRVEDTPQTAPDEIAAVMATCRHDRG